MRRLAFLLAAVAALVFAACGMADETKERAKAAQAAIPSTESAIKAALGRHAKLVQTHSTLLADASDEELDIRGFSLAQEALAKAKGVNRDTLEPLIEEDKAERRFEAENAIAEINALLKTARKEAKRPEQRAKAIVDFRPKAEALVAADLAAIKRVRADARRVAEKAERYAGKYPAQRAGLGQIIAPVESRVDAVRQPASRLRSESVATQYLAHTQFVALGNVYAKDAKRAEAQMDAIDQTVVRTLVDMKTECEITVERSAWDSTSDSSYEEEYEYDSVPVDSSGCAYWAKFADTSKDEGRFAVENDARLDLTGGVNAGQARKLKVDPMEMWDGSLDDGEYFIAEIEPLYFHKIRESRDGRVTTAWVEVDEAAFRKHEQDLGMDIYSKPVGLLENQAVTSPAPAGMAFVGNPQYGQWEQGANGSSFWTFFPAYLFLSSLDGDRRHSRAHYADWNRNYKNRRPYYGKCGPRKEDRCYGSGSTFVSAYYGTSSWHRGGSASSRTIRTSSASVRGGGPGGGGK